MWLDATLRFFIAIVSPVTRMPSKAEACLCEGIYKYDAYIKDLADN